MIPPTQRERRGVELRKVVKDAAVENPANPVESPAKPNANVESPAKPNVSVENPENNSFVFYLYFINKYK